MIIAMGMHLIIKAPVMSTWAVLKIVNKGWEWTAATGGAIILLIGTIITLMTLVIPRFKKIQKFMK